MKKAPPQKPLKKAVPPSPCRHPVLRFEAGGLYVACSACGQAWQAMNKERLIPDFMARGWNFTEQDTRVDPFAR